MLAGALILVGLGTLMVLSRQIGFMWARRSDWPARAVAVVSVIAAIESLFVVPIR